MYIIYLKTKAFFAHRFKQTINGGSRLIINIAILCLLGLITYKIYFPLPKIIDQTTSDTTNALLVQRNGSNLMLGSKNFHVVGINDYDLAYQDNEEIAHTFAQLHNAGVTTVRFWLFGDGNVNGFQPSAGHYNEMRFKQTDYLFYEAAKYQIKVIPTLVNNWTDYGGKDQYIRWINKNPASNEEIFYTDKNITKLVHNYIHFVLTRKNTYTHGSYADDPTILAWDIMNEPRSKNETAMNTWLIATASYIKQYDSNHLVFAGTEKTVTLDGTSDSRSSALCSSIAIDICSVHLYLFYNKQPLYQKYSDILSFLLTQENYANRVNKPILLEEFGIAKTTKPFGKDQLLIMKQVINDTQEENYSGYLLWNWSDVPDSAFTFSPDKYAKTHYSLTNLKQLLQN